MGKKKDEVIMKKISSSSKSFYPGILKEYLIESISKSRFKEKIVYEDLDNLSICIKGLCVTAYNVNKIFKEIFRDYEDIEFIVSEIKVYYQKNDYQEYLLKVCTNYKGAKWTIPIKVIGGFQDFPEGEEEIVYLPNSKDFIHILELKESEKIAYAFYKIMENILFTNDILLKYYNLYYHRKINKKKIVNEIVKLYENKNDTIKIPSMKNRIKLLKNNKAYEESWNNYRMRENVFIEYEDIIYFIHSIYLALRKCDIYE